MPYQRLLDTLVGSVAGAHAALLLDGTGEVVLESGSKDDRYRLIGAYQGIVLAHARKAAVYCDSGGLELVIARYDLGAVVLRPLKDDYYLVLCLGRDANMALALLHSADTERRMNAAL
jgi:predicted regulator of Ras-like GTPase activity (Roadblock/LC7/MglB family)